MQTSYETINASCVVTSWISSIQSQKEIFIKMSTMITRQTASRHEQNKVWAIWWFSWSHFCSLYEVLITNQNLHFPIEIDKRPVAEYPNKYYSEDTERHKTSAVPKFLSHISRDDEIAHDINSLNSKRI